MPEPLFEMRQPRDLLTLFEPGTRQVLAERLVGIPWRWEQMPSPDAGAGHGHPVNRRPRSLVKRRGPGLPHLVGVRPPGDRPVRASIQMKVGVLETQDGPDSPAAVEGEIQ